LKTPNTQNILKRYSAIIAKELNIKTLQVENTIDLLEDGATIPFISRYRKEKTDGLDEVFITQIRDRTEQLTELDKRRETILKSIYEQEKLTPELELQLNNALTLTELEDLYLPYKPKKKTKASVAKEKGLEPLAKILMAQNNNNTAIFIAEKFIKEALVANERQLIKADEALQGTRDIIAE
jgi:protein Tex